MRPSILKPGDIILFQNFGWLGSAISWGEWNGSDKEALEYSHIAMVLNDTEVVEMNPPASRRYPLIEVPWNRVDIYRVDADGVNPFDLDTVRSIFQAEAIRRLGEGYDYGLVAQAAGLSLLARIGLGGISRWILSRNNLAPDFHRYDCSIWVEEVESYAIRQVDPKFDFFPNLGNRQARPSDWPLSPFVKKLQAA